MMSVWGSAIRFWRQSVRLRTGWVAGLIAVGSVAVGYGHAATEFSLFPLARAAAPEPVAPNTNDAPNGAKSATSEPMEASLRWGDGVLSVPLASKPVAKAQRRDVPPQPRMAVAPHSPLTTMLQQAWQAYQAGRYAEARERYGQVMDGDNNADVQLGLAAIAVRQNRNAAAVRHYQRTLMLDPRNATALAALATLGDARYATDIEAQIKQLLDMQPSAALQFSLGNLYAGQQRWREAEAAYFESVQADSRHADYAYNLAVSLDHLRQYQAALAYYRKARDLAAAGDGQLDPLRLGQRIEQLQDAVSQSR